MIESGKVQLLYQQVNYHTSQQIGFFFEFMILRIILSESINSANALQDNYHSFMIYKNKNLHRVLLFNFDFEL